MNIFITITHVYKALVLCTGTVLVHWYSYWCKTKGRRILCLEEALLPHFQK